MNAAKTIASRAFNKAGMRFISATIMANSDN